MTNLYSQNRSFRNNATVVERLFDHVRMPTPPGPQMADMTRDLIADPAFGHEIEDLHRLGPRVTGELIVDLVRRHGHEIRERMVTFAALDPAALAALDALLWPPLPIYRVQVAA